MIIAPPKQTPTPQNQILLFGQIMISLGMFIQLFEFWGWIADIVNLIEGTGTPLNW